MPTEHVLARMLVYGLVLGVLDAVAGRTLQAAPDPSLVLPLGATMWAAYQLARMGRRRLALPAGLTLWVAYLFSFVASASALVGWNGSVSWHPRSAEWLFGFAAAAPVAAAIGQVMGAWAAARARVRAQANTAGGE